MPRMNAKNYTFGNSGEASARLRKLAELYEPETRELLARGGVRSPRLAVDLGCGPGWTTRLIYDVLRPRQTVGLDASEKFIAEARENNRRELEFHVADVVRGPFPVQSADALFCRFLLTHLSPLSDALKAWREIAAPGAALIIHETELLETGNAAMARYYELVSRLQEHYGQALSVGGLLDALVTESGWRIVESRRVVLEKPARRMAELHVANLRSWKEDEFAGKSFDARELETLERSLARIANGEDQAGAVRNAARQIIARRP